MSTSSVSFLTTVTVLLLNIMLCGIGNTAERGRVQILNGNVLTDNGLPLRGEHLRVSEMAEDGELSYRELLYQKSTWSRLITKHNLNTVRLLLYRPPQSWDNNDPHGCTTPINRCYNTVSQIIPHLDKAVDNAEELGMYVIIDYHPVGGYQSLDATTWWSTIAPRYKNRTHVMYELTNEPVQWSAASYTNDDVQYMDNLFTLVRNLAPETHIIVWSIANASGGITQLLDRAPAIDYSNASVGYHPYGLYNENELISVKNRGVAIINTEIGAYSREEYVNRTNIAEALNVSWIWLDGNGIGKSWGDTNPLPVTWPRDPKTVPGTVNPPGLPVKALPFLNLLYE